MFDIVSHCNTPWEYIVIWRRVCLVHKLVISMHKMDRCFPRAQTSTTVTSSSVIYGRVGSRALDITQSKFILSVWFWCELFSWWRHQIETFSALLALCVRKSPVTCKFPSQRQVTRSVDVAPWINGWVNNREAGDFSAQMARNAENVSIWWCHHGLGRICLIYVEIGILLIFQLTMLPSLPVKQMPLKRITVFELMIFG